MKKFGQILTVAICLAVALVGCIKEESYKVEKALLTVDLTRGATSSQEQGDRIEDVMIWAFRCKLDDTTGAVVEVDQGAAAGWRYQQNVNTYQNITLHVELPICAGEQDYIVMTVLNTEAYGWLSTTLGRNTTYEELAKAVFNADLADFWGTYPKDKNPELMPISNWKTMTIKSSNTHPDNCYHLTMPVYRTVAKAQLYMNTSSDLVDVTVKDAMIVSSSAFANSVVFTGNTKVVTGSNGEKSMQGNCDMDVAVPQPLDPLFLRKDAINKQLWNTSTSKWTSVTVDAVAVSGDVNDPYTWVGSTFLYENDEALTETGYDTLPTSNGGYYMQITYDMTVSDNTESNIVKYVPLPAIVRNHDYTVKATVEQAVDGHLVINYVVTEWETKTIDVPPFN